MFIFSAKLSLTDIGFILEGLPHHCHVKKLGIVSENLCFETTFSLPFPSSLLRLPKFVAMHGTNCTHRRHFIILFLLSVSRKIGIFLKVPRSGIFNDRSRADNQETL